MNFLRNLTKETEPQIKLHQGTFSKTNHNDGKTSRFMLSSLWSKVSEVWSLALGWMQEPKGCRIGRQTSAQVPKTCSFIWSTMDLLPKVFLNVWENICVPINSCSSSLMIMSFPGSSFYVVESKASPLSLLLCSLKTRMTFTPVLWIFRKPDIYLQAWFSLVTLCSAIYQTITLSERQREGSFPKYYKNRIRKRSV